MKKINVNKEYQLLDILKKALKSLNQLTKNRIFLNMMIIFSAVVFLFAALTIYSWQTVNKETSVLTDTLQEIAKPTENKDLYPAETVSAPKAADPNYFKYLNLKKASIRCF